MSCFLVLKNHTKEVNCCTFSKKYLVTCSGDKTVRVYSVLNFQELPYSPINIFKYGVNSLTFNNDESMLATACSDGKAHLFCLTDKKAEIVGVFQHADVSTAQVCSFSNRTNYLVTGSADGTIALWDIVKKKQLRQISGHPESNVYAATFTPCDCYIVSGSGVGNIRVWSVNTMQATMLPLDAHDAGLSSCGVSCITFSPTFHSSLTSSTRCFLMASSGHDNKVKLWIFNNEAKSLRLQKELSGHSGPVSFCCFSANGMHLASSSFDGSIVIWNPSSYEQELRLDSHETIVTSVAFSKTNYLASTSCDKKVIIWKVNSGTGGEIDKNLFYLPSESGAQLTVAAPEETEKFAQSLKPSYQDWSCEQVASWLNDEVKLSQYADIFKENDIDGRELDEVTAEVLQKDLGVVSLGHRNKIMRAIKALRDGGLTSSAPSISQLQDLYKPANEGDPPPEYLCPISLDIMFDPVTAADGFTYERKEIEAWFKRTGTISPMTGKQLTSDDLHPNQTVRSLIDEFLSKQKCG
ncbi:WD repeat, SAM and U-box domain-containing protein 1-like [Clavelina lepadiformis]|uniref:WD repeat, SAM and U-box domain-containing protein 1-like n=1 Tax=Clavelina lepadiformis TaxID=159417 RepID=UPI004042629C